ncbi:MAG: hypothetical protein WCQ64_03935 [Acidobacteriota bacterium]
MRMLAVIVGVGVCARGWIVFSAEQMPGVNGAYSLVQTRSLIEKGTLGLPDFPLTFVLQAGVAWLLHHIARLGMDVSVAVAVKLCVSLLPPLAAVPVLFLGRTWSARAGRPNSRLPLVAAAMVSFGGPALAMTGNIDKNALALVWLSGMLWALHACMARPSLAALAATNVCLVLVGLTHVGVFGAALVVAACVCAVYVTRPSAPPLTRTLPAIAGSMAIIGATESLVFWKFDPARIERLARAVTDPAAFLWRPPSPSLLISAPPSDGLPFVLIATTVAHLAVLGGLAACVLRMVWRRRDELNDAQIALVCGSVPAIAAMTGPWVVHGDAALRLALIAVLPAIVVAMFALLYAERRRLRRALTILLCLAVIGPGVPYLVVAWRPLNAGAYEEMKSLSADIPRPARTLIVAEHGIEWNAAWVLHTHVAQTSALSPDDWQRYDEVLFLVSKDAPAPFGPPGSGPHPPGPGPRPPMRKPVRIPEGAVILHDGQHLTLARVSAPSPSIVRRSTT